MPQKTIPTTRTTASLLGSAALLLGLAWLGAPRTDTARAAQADGTPVLANDALFSAPINTLEATKATREETAVIGQPFSKALKVTLPEKAPETNATQLLASTIAPVVVGDTLVASFFIRGAAKDGKPGSVILMFEKSSSPWTKSVIFPASTDAEAMTWKKVVVPFTAAESYAPGEAMLSLRLATQPQTVEIADLSLRNFGRGTSKDELLDRVSLMNPVGKVAVRVEMNQERQTMEGFGGNFCKGRFGMTEPNDAVGRYTLKNLQVRHARIGIPLQYWQDGPGQPYKDEGPNHATFLLMQEMKKRKIPMVASIWDAPKWMLANPERDAQRVIPRERWEDAIEAITQWLAIARDTYGVEVEYISFNEADGGYQIKFTSQEIAAFIKLAMPRLQRYGLKVKWLAGDTASGGNLVNYTRPLLEDPKLARHLGPISFHSWDALRAAPEEYAAIARLAQEFKRPVWCLEVGHDPQLWRADPPVWPTWENGVNLAHAYLRTIKYARASLLDYWEYQADYPLVDGEKNQPYPAFYVVQQLEQALPPGSKVVESASPASDTVLTLAAKNIGKSGYSVLLLNTGGPGEATLSGLPGGTVVTLCRTSRSEGNKRLPTRYTVAANGTVTVPLAARSLTTVESGWPR